jgi:hypothetical protein
MRNLAVICGECSSAQKFLTRLCLLELMFVTRENKVLSASVQHMTNTCANITPKQVHSLKKVKKLFRQLFSLTISNVHSLAIESSIKERCLIIFLFIVMVSAIQCVSKLLTLNLSNSTRSVKMSMACWQMKRVPMNQRISTIPQRLRLLSWISEFANDSSSRPTATVSNLLTILPRVLTLIKVSLSSQK